MEPIGQRIKKLMEDKGLNQEAVAEGGALSQSYLSKLIQGKTHKPSFEMLHKVATGLQVSLLELLVDTEFQGLLHPKGPPETVYCPNVECEMLEIGIPKEGGMPSVKKRFHTDRFFYQGEEIKFCPFCGKKLISRCSKCNTRIFNWESYYCVGCGEKILELEKKQITK